VLELGSSLILTQFKQSTGIDFKILKTFLRVKVTWFLFIYSKDPAGSLSNLPLTV